ncbi:MAG: bifunctional diguanylate cyclase/phosphohydrolase, partial [Armatimonadota bacterium]
VGYAHVIEEHKALSEAKSDKYASLSAALSTVFDYAARRGHKASFSEIASRFLETDPDISSITLTDSEGRVLAIKSRDLEVVEPSISPRDIFGIIAQAMGYPADSIRRITIRVPIGTAQHGTLVITYTARSLVVATEEALANLVFTLAVACIVGLLLGIYIAKLFSKPLGHLVTAAKSIGKGNLDVSVPDSSIAEMHELAEAFNGMIVALKESRDKLIERANTDSLTGLYNHRCFQERLRSELKRAERYSRPFSVVMIDIDHFKTLNDTHGHPVGDNVLREVASILQSQVRKDIDFVARYGGEEFALILPETDAENAMFCAEQLRKAVANHSFLGKNGETVPITISLGVAQYPIHSSEREGLIIAADLALYQSKSTGRNRTSVFSNDSRADRNKDPYNLYLLLQATDMSTLEAMAAAVDTKGLREPGFSKAVVAHAVALAREIGLSEQEQRDIRVAALLHDIGKLGIPDTILNKREPLTPDELNIIRSHPSIGYAIVQRSEHLKSILPGILHHHEWWDGTGYPNGQRGEEIPIFARIIAVVDSYHAMMTERPHARARTPEEAKTEIRRCAGTQFDPKIVRAFLRVLESEERLAA